MSYTTRWQTPKWLKALADLHSCSIEAVRKKNKDGHLQLIVRCRCGVGIVHLTRTLIQQADTDKPVRKSANAIKQTGFEYWTIDAYAEFFERRVSGHRPTKCRRDSEPHTIVINTEATP